MKISADSVGPDKAVRFLNFGCGATFHPEWTNLDTSPISSEIIAHDLRKKFPFADETFDAVYGSHVLEHLEPAEAAKLLQDCFRILRPEGSIRLAVPDLEAIVRLYLSSLESALNGQRNSQERYDWLMLELYDQCVRNLTGGRMAEYLKHDHDAEHLRFIASRIGPEILQGVQPTFRCEGARSGFSRRIAHRIALGLDKARQRLVEAFATLVIGRRGALALRYGLFRISGEVHQWMYDRYSLRCALENAGFTVIRVCGADESAIPGFSTFGLETIETKPRKPDSLYMEGRKPVLNGLIDSNG